MAFNIKKKSKIRKQKKKLKMQFLLNNIILKIIYKFNIYIFKTVKLLKIIVLNILFLLKKKKVILLKNKKKNSFLYEIRLNNK